MNYRLCSRTLGDQVELFLGLLPTQPEGSHETRATVNRTRWFAIIRDSTQRARFLLSLSVSQLSSHQLLREWLTGRCDDTNFDLDARDGERAFNAELKSEYLSPPAIQKNYHYHLARLLYYDFSYPGGGTPLELHVGLVEQVRRDAAIYASCHRLAIRCYWNALTPTQQRDSFQPQSFSVPYSASIDPCIWLEMSKTADDGLPFYLWDVKGKKTRIAKEIAISMGAIPEYVAISHTWGRWIRDEDPLVELNNVPWKIPANERFIVEDLPTTLQNLPYDYIWLDLLTIPQKDLSDELLIIQQAEIGRQATIFANALHAIALFHDIPIWSSLPAVIQYMSLSFLANSQSRNTDKETLSSLLDTASEGAAGFIELLVQPADEKVYSRRRKPNSWFTSLWTLQETCLRPDMLLSTSDWKLLREGEDAPIALNEIVALYQVNPNLRRQTGLYPVGIQELRQLVGETGLQNLLQPSQLSIITMGNERHCLERRAEAIMSAIGATDWFEGASHKQREEDLVIDLYPLPFIEEVRRKLGSATFFSSTPLGWEFHYVLRKYCSDKRTKSRKFEELGSLLPFGPGAQNIAFDIESNPHMVEHPALESWSIENSGCVRISLAGIVSSSMDEAPASPIYCIIAAPSAKNDENKLIYQNNADLHVWIRSYKPESPNFAVCLLHSPLASRGILLKQMESGILLKIGSYWQMERPQYTMPESKTVDWLIM